MSDVLAAARRLAEEEPVARSYRTYLRTCLYCQDEGDPSTGDDVEHAPDCPWLHLPQIVAALEAARTIVSEDLGRVSDYATSCPFCGGVMIRGDIQDRWHIGFEHYDGCPWESLRAALVGSKDVDSE